MDGPIRIFSNAMKSQTHIQSLLRKYSTWPLNEMLSLLLSPTHTPDGACSVGYENESGDLWTGKFDLNTLRVGGA